MFKDVHEYLSRLKRELKGSDSALTQDALADAEEHLRNALDNAKKEAPNISETEALSVILEKYGEPSEVASAYKEIEYQISSFLYPPKLPKTQSHLVKFFSIYGDSQAWAAVLYMLFSLVTGILFGLWALLGMSLSLISLVFIIGLPLTGLFLLSLRGIALIEGRIVDALLSIRMPRKPIFVQKDLNLTKKLKALITESQTWKIYIYLITRLILSIVFSIGLLTLFAFSIKLMSYPVLAPVLKRPLITLGEQSYHTSIWLYPVVSLVGFVFFSLSLHLTKLVGKISGRYAKAMLVRRG